MKYYIYILSIALVITHPVFSKNRDEKTEASLVISTCSTSENGQIISTARNYLGILKCPKLAGKVHVRGLVGRVLKGKMDKDFETLSNDPARKLIFLMGSDGLEELVGLNNDQILFKIGYTLDYIEHIKKEGYKFRLVVFKSEREDGQSATWDNVARLAERLYPTIASKIEHVLPMLKRSKFTIIESGAPSKFSDVDKIGKDHPDYIDEVKLAKLEGKLWEVRGFLYYRARLMDLFAGDGFTYDEKGKKGLKEFIVANKLLKQLSGASYIDL